MSGPTNESSHPKALRPIGLVLTIGAAVGLGFAIREYRSYPDAPERLTLAEALSRADSEKGNLWVAIPAPALACDLAFRQRHYTYVPLAQDPLVIANYSGRFDCDAIDREQVVGLIRRAPPRWVEHVVGKVPGPVYELTTWGGPSNVQWAISLALAGVFIGVMLFAVGQVLARSSERV
jgi:hypothetical protein